MSSVGSVEHKLLRQGYRQGGQSPDQAEGTGASRGSGDLEKKRDGHGPAAILDLSPEARQELNKAGS